MKTLILTLMLACAVYGQSCLGEKYEGLFKTIEKPYKKQQSNYKGAMTPHYNYKIIPLEFFPFLFVNKDTTKSLATMNEKILCSSNYTIMSKSDKVSEHVVVAVLSYLMWGTNPPPEKVYRLHYLYYEPITKEWVQEKKPLIVTMKLTNKEEGWYAPK